MATKWYQKEIPEMPVYVHGTPIKFEVLETADPVLIEELDKCIKFGRGGVAPITKEQFDELAQKKTNETRSESGFKQSQHRHELSAPNLNLSHAVDGASPDVRFGGIMAKAQERDHTPHNRFGLRGGAPGPAPARPMPDPIELPTPADMAPPTAKLSEVNGA
jgi:hypothetical protein